MGRSVRPRRLLYGWRVADKEYRLSLYPADAPVRPSIAFESIADVNAWCERKRADVMWWPPLPDDIDEAA